MKNRNRYRTWFLGVCGCAAAGILGCAAVNVIVDPFFHYHAPLDGLEYPLNNERYQNDGILRHFTYDSIITGTSMTENFRSSEFDALFEADAVKTSFEGASFKEIADRLRTGLESGNEVRYVLRCLDMDYLDMDKDQIRTDLGAYPEYLYDEELFNDINYVLNKDVLAHSGESVLWTLMGRKTTSFDDYKRWNEYFSFGKDQVLAAFERRPAADGLIQMTEEERQRIRDNIAQNVAQLAADYPETEFLLYLAPYSICWWDQVVVRAGKLQWELEAQRIVLEELLEYDNIRFYSFSLNQEVVCDLDNYKDMTHHGDWVNTWILEWIRSDKYRITADNYERYLEELESFYGAYDYDSIYE